MPRSFLVQILSIQIKISLVHHLSNPLKFQKTLFPQIFKISLQLKIIMHLLNALIIPIIFFHVCHVSTKLMRDKKLVLSQQLKVGLKLINKKVKEEIKRCLGSKLNHLIQICIKIFAISLEKKLHRDIINQKQNPL